MWTAPFLRRTGQSWKPKLGFLVEAIAFLCIVASHHDWWGAVHPDNGIFVVMGAIAIGMVAFIGQIQFIRCPKCDTKLFWHAVNAQHTQVGSIGSQALLLAQFADLNPSTEGESALW